MNHTLCGLTEVKFSNDSTDLMSFSGYGAAFNNIDSYGDVIAPGAFAAFIGDVKSGKQPWPSMLSQHGGFGLTAEDMTPVGVWTSLSEDASGLIVTGQLADTPRGREMHSLMKMSPRPAIDGLSIGYIPKEFEPRSKPTDPRRLLKRIDLVEISPVTFPANRKALIGSVKSLEDLNSLAEIEECLREAGGFSKGEAKLLIARIKADTKREALASDGLDVLAARLRKNLLTMKGNT